MSKETIWVVSQSSLWGYGLTATGRTKEKAKEAFWKAYCNISPGWNDGKRAFKTFDSLDAWCGISIQKYTIGKAYFGDEDEE